MAFLLALFGQRFEPLLPYLKCLLFGFHSVRNSCNNGDGLYHISSGRERKKVYDALRRAGLRYDENVKALIRKAASLGMLSHVIDLSLDATHLMYHGTKRLREWGAPFSTWLNRSFPGLNPTTAYDLASGLFLYVFDFVCKASLNNRTYGKGKVVLGRVRACAAFLESASVRVRSVTGDEAFFSYPLLKWLVESKIRYRIAVSSRSVLRGYVPKIEEWVSMKEDGRVIGIFRGAVYRGIRTNLLAVKHHGSTYLYVTSTRTLGALDAMKQYWRRGNHEKAIGYLKSFLSFARIPSTKLSKIKGHVFSCLLLYVLLRLIAKELNLEHADGVSPATMQALLERPGVEKLVKDEEGATVGVMALVVVNRALMRRIGGSRIEIGESVIEFVEFRQSRSRRRTEDFFPWNHGL